MEVIKNGQDKKFITSCYKCKSNLKYNLHDVKEKEDSKYDYDGKLYYENINRIICPVCGENIIPNYQEEENK